MPQETGYRSQVAPATPAGMPQASPAAFGATIGGAIAQVGESLGRRELQDIQIERERRRGDEWADFSARFAALRLEADVHETDLRAAMPAGGAGYAKARADWLAARTAPLLEGLTEDSVRRQAQTQLSDYGARIGSEAYAVETGARIKKRTTDVQSQADISANRVLRDPATYRDELLQSLTAVEGMDDVPADVRDGLHKLTEEKLAIALLNGTTRTDPKAALVLIGSGAFDKILSPEQVEQLRTRGEIGVRQQEIVAEREAAKAQAVDKEEEGLLLKQVSDGVELDPAQLVTAAQRAQARGDAGRAYELTTAAAAMKLAAPFANANAEQLTGALQKIEGDKNWRADPIKVAQHDWLEKKRTELRAADPAIAAPDWTNPRSIASFEAAIRADAADRGTVPQYLTREIADQFKPMMNTMSGRAEVLETLNRMTPAAAAAAARQLAPDDRVFQGAAVLSDPVRRIVLSGQEVLKAGTTPVTANRTRPTFQTYAAPALKALAGDTTVAVKETADAIAAELASRRNLKDAKDAGDDLYREALHLALGGGARNGEPTGGLGWWENGRSRGVRIVLPTGMTQREFDTRLARLNGPLNAWWGKQQMTAAQLRQHFTPVAVGDGVYEWEDAQGRAVKAKDGTDARLYLKGGR